MTQTSSALSMDFLFPMLHGKWAASVAGEALTAVIERGRDGALGRLLAGLGIDTRHRDEVQKALTRRLIGELARIRRLLDERTGRFYGVRIERHAIENIKTLLHYRQVPDRSVPIAFLLIDSPYLPRLDVERLLAAEDSRLFFHCLPPHSFQSALGAVFEELDRSGDLPVAECRLDSLYFRALLAAAHGLPHRLRGTAVELVGTEIDVMNIMIILRNTQLYRLPAAAIHDLCMAGGRRFRPEHVRRACDATTRADVIARLPAPYRDLLTPLLPAPLHLSETTLWRHLHRMAHSAFRDFERPGRSLVAFPFLKRAEMLNLGRVFEGLHFGLEPQAIHATIIGVDHVPTR